MSIMQIPTTPNRPLVHPDQNEPFGKMRLRFNAELEMVENAAFESALVNYDDGYQNNQSLSNVFRHHMQDVYQILKSHYPRGSKLVEVGCGKGDFIELVEKEGFFQVEGYDGAYDGINPAIHKRYLSMDDNLDADIVVLRHVLEHIQKPHDFLFLLKTVFGDVDIYIEVPEFQWILDSGSFFDITYEHVNYFKQTSLKKLFNSSQDSGLLFSEQYQFIISNLGDLSHQFANSYEIGSDWLDVSMEALFPSLTDKINEIFKKVSNSQNKAYIWGASTKGVMFIHHLKYAHKECFQFFNAAIDINQKKVGKFLPSSGLPIFSVEQFFHSFQEDDLVVIANPNYKSEILDEFNRNGFNNIEVISL